MDNYGEANADVTALDDTARAPQDSKQNARKAPPVPPRPQKKK